MAAPRDWTGEADATIRRMRGEGATWADIGIALGISRNTVIERGRRLKAAAPQRVSAAPPSVEDQVSDDPNRGPLRAGHPLTWGLIAKGDPFPT